MTPQETNAEHFDRMMDQAAKLMVLRYLGDLVEGGIDRNSLELALLLELHKPENIGLTFLELTALVRKAYTQ